MYNFLIYHNNFHQYFLSMSFVPSKGGMVKCSNSEKCQGRKKIYLPITEGLLSKDKGEEREFQEVCLGWDEGEGCKSRM